MYIIEIFFNSELTKDNFIHVWFQSAFDVWKATRGVRLSSASYQIFYVGGTSN